MARRGARRKPIPEEEINKALWGALSYHELAGRWGISVRTVQRRIREFVWQHRHEIPKRPQGFVR